MLATLSCWGEAARADADLLWAQRCPAQQARTVRRAPDNPAGTGPWRVKLSHCGQAGVFSNRSRGLEQAPVGTLVACEGVAMAMAWQWGSVRCRGGCVLRQVVPTCPLATHRPGSERASPSVVFIFRGGHAASRRPAPRTGVLHPGTQRVCAVVIWGRHTRAARASREISGLEDCVAAPPVQLA